LEQWHSRQCIIYYCAPAMIDLEVVIDHLGAEQFAFRATG